MRLPWQMSAVVFNSRWIASRDRLVPWSQACRGDSLSTVNAYNRRRMFTLPGASAPGLTLNPAGQVLDLFQYVLRLAGQVDGRDFNGLVGVCDAVFDIVTAARVVLGGVDKQARGQVGGGAVGQNLVDVGVGEVCGRDAFVLGIADEYGVVGASPNEVRP